MSWLTRVVYVVAAVLVGTFFVAIAYFSDSAESWGREGRWASGFALIYSLALAGGFLVQIVFALLLRGVAQATRFNGFASWTASGAMLGVAVPWAFARLGYLIDGLYFPAGLQRAKFSLMFCLQGSMMFVAQPLWVLAAVGAVTGAVLWFVTACLAAWSEPRRAGI